MTYEMYEVKIEVTGREMHSLVYWLVENIDEWNISFGYNTAINQRGGTRTHTIRISSVNWRDCVYQIQGISYGPYMVNVMLQNDIDTMAVKLAW